MLNSSSSNLLDGSQTETQNSLMPLELAFILKKFKVKVDLQITNKMRIASQDKTIGRTDHLACDFIIINSILKFKV